MMNTELLTYVSGGLFVVVLRGELDTTDAQSAAGEVAALTPGGRRSLVDRQDPDFLDRQAAGALAGVRVIRAARSGRGLPPGAWCRREERRGGPGPRAGVWSWPPRWPGRRKRA